VSPSPSEQAYTFCESSDSAGLAQLLSAHTALRGDDAVTAFKDRGGLSCYQKAAEVGSPECLKLLLDSKVSVDNVCAHEGAGLAYATMNGRTDCMRLLIDNNADVGHVNKIGAPALHYAALIGQPDAKWGGGGRRENVQLLIDSNADLNFKSVEGFTAVMLSCQKGRADNLEVLLNAGADATLLADGPRIMSGGGTAQDAVTQVVTMVDSVRGLACVCVFMWLVCLTSRSLLLIHTHALSGLL
jgi:ankyrin repeat protein